MNQQDNMQTKDYWRGRLSGKMPENVLNFISSLNEDARLVEIDIDVVQAHNLMLYRQNIISKEDAAKIMDGLEKARSAWQSGQLKLANYIDIHPLVESYLMDSYGVEIGGKSHLGKSRNDQVMADVRIYLRNATLETSELLADFCDILLNLAQAHTQTLMPGYTHTQQAQVITLAHYLLSYSGAFQRDMERLEQCYSRINLNPLGACALAGTSLPLDRNYTSELLGFDDVLENSIDAISNRDFAVELAGHLANLMATLSRMANDLILWSSYEFAMVELADELTDISSAMPQKKNPCPLEMLRGKTGTVYGNLMQLLTMLHATPTGYNKDLQETKPPLWQALDTVQASLRVLCQVWNNITIKKERMYQLVCENQITALDLAELLVRSGLAFRQAHFLVGQLVRECSRQGKAAWQNLNVKQVNDTAQTVAGKTLELNQEELSAAINPAQSVASRSVIGGPAEIQTKAALIKQRQKLSEQRQKAEDKRAKLKSTHENLKMSVRDLQINPA
ncbi:MAG: argininosuccinate lyase [Candidatus Schekmanbacteria bacterium]|nr:argininosuccinate lyase [Candidatus Schekmanbacteria bacterium]